MRIIEFIIFQQFQNVYFVPSRVRNRFSKINFAETKGNYVHNHLDYFQRSKQIRLVSMNSLAQTRY